VSRYFKNREGGVLVIVLIVMMILSILGGTALSYAVSENRFSVHQENMQKAYYIARAGAQSVAEYMMKDPDNKASELIGKTSSPNTQIGGGSFTVKVEEITASKDVLLTSVGTYRGIEQTAKIRLKGTSKGGVGGIFDHAIAAVNLIFANNKNANNTVIEGSVASKNNDIPDYIIDKVTDKENSGKDPNLVFPPIVLPSDYDDDWGDLKLKNTTLTVSTTDGSPKYIRADSLTIKNATLSVTGDGVLHVYIVGGINSGGFLTVDTNGQISVSPNAKIYFYVIPSENNKKPVTFVGNGHISRMFLYAPNSKVEVNNSGAAIIEGAIIGDTVEIHNKTSIKYDGSLVSDIELDTSVAGVTFVGYTWVD
jgi:type II secretory pathway pseudopilin PulG